MRSKPNFVTHDALESSTIVWKRKIVAAAAVEFFVNAVVPRALTLLLEWRGIKAYECFLESMIFLKLPVVIALINSGRMSLTTFASLSELL